jgi:SAM-dependent methyltransferase
MTHTERFTAREPPEIADEAERLEWQANFIGDAENRIMGELGLPRAGKILEVGCGTGDVLLRLRAFRPGLEIIGLDRSDPDAQEISKPEQTKARLARENLGDAYHVVDAVTGDYPCVDAEMTYARLLLRHVSDPLRVVEKMREATVPGGRIMLIDTDDRTLILHPVVLGFSDAVMGAYELAPSAIPNIGRRLVELAHGAGLVNIDLRVLTLSTAELSPKGFSELLRPYRTPQINGFGPEQSQCLERAFEAWAADEGAFAMWTLIFVGGSVPRLGSQL